MSKEHAYAYESGYQDGLRCAETENAKLVAKLRELCVDFASMLTYAGLEGLKVEATIGGVTKTYDASELCDKVEEIWDKED